MACTVCNQGLKMTPPQGVLPIGAEHVYSQNDTYRLPLSSHKQGEITESIKNKANDFNKLGVVEPSLKEHIVNGSNAVPPVLVPNGITLPTKKKADKKDLPSIKEMAFGLTEALKENITNAVTNGVILASQEEMEKRFSICLGCEFLIAEHSRCLKCGCFMNMKTRLKVSKCPVNKW